MSFSEVRLKDLCAPGGLQTGPFGSQLKASQYAAEGVPVVMPKDMVRGRVSCDTIARVPRAVAERLTKHRCKPGDVLFARRGEIGRFALITQGEEGWICGTGCLRFRPNEEVVPKLLCLALQQPDAIKWLQQNAVGQTMLNLNTDIVGALPLRIPPLGDHKKIADVVSAWDQAETCLRSLLLGKSERKRGLMQQLLTGRTRFKEFKGQPWRMVRIGDLLEPINRYVEWDNDRVYRLAGVRRNGGGLFFRDELPGTEIKVKVCKKIRAGDFLISRRQMTYGGMALVPAWFDGFDVNDEYEVLAVKGGAKFEMRFFSYLAETPALKHAAYVASNGFFAERLRLNLDLEEFLSHRISVPPSLGELREVVSVLDAATQEIELLEKQLSALKEQKRGLMQKLLTGEVRVKC